MHFSNAAGRVWFEVEVVEAKGRALVGIAGTNFPCIPTVGTDAASWSIYSDSGGVLHSRHVLTLIFLSMSLPGTSYLAAEQQCCIVHFTCGMLHARLPPASVPC